MNTGFKHNIAGELEYLTIPAFEHTKVVSHCFTTRLGGVSSGECTAFNLGFNKNDTRANVIDNFKIITEQIGICYKDLVLSNQVHKDNIKYVTSEDVGKGIIRESDIKEIDALITDKPNVALVTFYADCVPLFFLDPVKKVIALAHSGWRGTVKKIGSKTVKMMINDFKCNINNILVGIGPSIGKCHFEVDKPVADIFHDTYGKYSRDLIELKSNNKYYIDLWNANIYQLKQIGINDVNITLAGECTYCNNDKYFSYRGDKGKTGSLAAIMSLKSFDK